MPDYKKASLNWIKEYADDLGLYHETLLAGADEWVATHDGRWGGQYLVDGGNLEGVYTSDEFWVHYQIVRGVEIREDIKTNFFSCSC